MSLPWFRLYAEFAHDPKVQMLSETDQRRYIMLLCLRCSNGDVTLHETAVAFQLRISDEEWCATKQRLIASGLINEDNKPTAWDRRQFRSDSSAARVSRHRAKKGKSSNGDVTLHVTKSNALDTDTDTDSKPLVRSPSGFAEFWSAYPKKVGKGAAEKAWGRAKINGHIAEVLSALQTQRQSEQWRKDGGQFIPNPATWINQRRWEDGPAGGQPGNWRESPLFKGAL